MYWYDIKSSLHRVYVYFDTGMLRRATNATRAWLVAHGVANLVSTWITYYITSFPPPFLYASPLFAENCVFQFWADRDKGSDVRLTLSVLCGSMWVGPRKSLALRVRRCGAPFTRSTSPFPLRWTISRDLRLYILFFFNSLEVAFLYEYLCHELQS